MWIELKGEKNHSCNLPDFVEGSGPSATHLQKRHKGSIWECDCKMQYEWSGKKWKQLS